MHREQSLYVLGLVLYSTALPAAEARDMELPSGESKTEKGAVVLPEMTVTAAPDNQRYQDPSSTAGTRFPAPITRVPQSIQVIR